MRKPMTTTVQHLLIAVMLLGVVGAMAIAQGEEPLVSGLTEPRMLSFDSDGNLYIAEAGYGGDVATQWGEPDRFTVPATLGGTSQIRVVSPDGESSVLLGGLVSVDGAPPPGLPPHARNIYGTTVALPHQDALWVAFGAGPAGTPANPFTSTVLELDRETLRIRNFIDIAQYEMEHDPDGAGIGNNPTDLAVADDGTVYIADAGCNCLLSWTEQGGLELFSAWAESPQAVPDTVDIGPDGDIYVGFLTGVPFPTEGSRIERWTSDGELEETFTGLTMVVDILVEDDGTLYAVEFASGFQPPMGLPAYSGRVVEVTSEGITPIAEKLNYPYGIARSPDGPLIVANNTAFVGEGFGHIIPIETP